MRTFTRKYMRREKEHESERDRERERKRRGERGEQEGAEGAEGAEGESEFRQYFSLSITRSAIKTDSNGGGERKRNLRSDNSRYYQPRACARSN